MATEIAADGSTQGRSYNNAQKLRHEGQFFEKVTCGLSRGKHLSS